MPLASAQIVDGVVTLLKTVPASGARVFAARGWPLADTELPAWVVIAQGESLEVQTIHFPSLQRHTLSVDAVVKVRAVSDLDDAMHDLALAAMTALQGTAAAASLGSLPNVDCNVAGIDRELIGDGEAALGQLTLHLSITFQTMQNAPGVLV